MVHSAPIGGVSSPAAPAISVSLAGVDIPALNGLIGLSQSEVKYVAFLAAGIPLGYLWSRCPRGTARHAYSTLVGAAMIFTLFGAPAFVTYVPAILTWLSMLYVPDHCVLVAWLTNFGYLIIHTLHSNQIQFRAGQHDHSAVIMVMVLKVISMAANYADYRSGKRHARAIPAPPTFLEMLGYCTMVNNNLAGPCAEIRSYLDYCRGEGVWDDKRTAVEVRRESQWGRVGAKFAQGCVWAGLQVACKVAYRTLPPTWAWLSFNPHLVLTERFAEWSFWQRQLYMAGAMYLGTCPKYFCVWSWAEAGMAAAGISKTEREGGVYWDAFENVRPLSVVLLASSPNTIAANWNIQTGAWLRHYVYDRVWLSHDGRPTFLSLAAAQVVSLIWHGLDVGYLVMFLSSILYLHAGKSLYRLSQSAPPPTKRALQVANWALGQALNTHCGTAFALLTLEGARVAIGRVYAWGHVLAVSAVVVAAVGTNKKRGAVRGKGGEGRGARAPQGKGEEKGGKGE